MAFSRGIHDLGRFAERADGFRDEAPVPGVAGGDDLFLTIAADRLGLLHDARIGRRQHRVAEV